MVESCELVLFKFSLDVKSLKNIVWQLLRARWCTRLKIEKQLETYTEITQCTQPYQAKCGWFTNDMCTYYEWEHFFFLKLHIIYWFSLPIVNLQNFHIFKNVLKIKSLETSSQNLFLLTCVFFRNYDCTLERNRTIDKIRVIEECCNGYEIDPSNNFSCIRIPGLYF